MSARVPALGSKAYSDDEEEVTEELTEELDSDDEEDEDEEDVPWILRGSTKAVGGLIIMILWVIIGVIIGMTAEGWGFVTSLYVIIQIVTTIGYGDITVTHPATKWFMTFYVFIGIGFVAALITEASNWLLDKEAAYVRKKLRKIQNRLDRSIVEDEQVANKYGAFNQLLVSTLIFLFFVFSFAWFYSWYESCSCSYGISKIEGCVEDLDWMGREVGDQCANPPEGAVAGKTKSYADGIYMAVVTMTTVGFGDYSPKSRGGRIFGCVYCTLAVVACGNFVMHLSSCLSEHYKNIKKSSRMSLDIFPLLDVDGNGNLSRAEFRAFVLLKEGVICKKDLRRIDNLFDTMDITRTGTLDYDDIAKEFEGEEEDLKSMFKVPRRASLGTWYQPVR